MFRVSLVLMSLAVASSAHAIRPFITDDARVVGGRRLQLETWVQGDKTSFQHWVLPAFGPTDHIEITVGAVHGAAYDGAPASYSVAGPLLQMKLLLHTAQPNGWPGVAIAGGIITPVGHGELTPHGVTGFAYLALTESLGANERVLIYANIGVHAHSSDEQPQATVTAGLGTQVRLYRGLHGVAEIVYADAYAGATGAAVQGGFRYIVNDNIQLDTTAGTGFYGDNQRPTWGTLGLRMVTNPLW